MSAPEEQRRAIPSVERILRALGPLPLPRPLALRRVRAALAAIRVDGRPVPDEQAIVAALRAELEGLANQRVRSVINGTGVVIHTNLGRAPLAAAAVDAMAEIARGYSNLEFDLASGTRGRRGAYLEESLAALCEAEAAAVVNNCAAALVLIVRLLTSAPPRERVVISRGELVQIGGGFRVPDILIASGAQLHEVGTTNRTTPADYRDAVDDRTAMILRVQRSNFSQSGFVEDVPSATLAMIAREKGIAFVEDLGSGATFDTSELGTSSTRAAPEPTPSAAIAGGADLVCFSGDKLLGGPQLGVIAGRASLVRALKAHPLYRALRCDKLTIAAAQATVESLLSADAQSVPVRRMLDEPVDALQRRADQIVAALAGSRFSIDIRRGTCRPGGGTLPDVQIASVTLAIHWQRGTVQSLADAFRSRPTPIVGYVSDDRFHIDLRTVFPSQDGEVIDAFRALSAEDCS